MKSYRCSLIVAVVVLATTGPDRAALAQQVFAGDPVDAATSAPYPVMPGVALVLPGPDEDFGTADDVVDGGIVGDIDLVVRVGTVAAGLLPAPAGAAGGPALTTTVAGGGSSGQGAETSFSVHVSSGTGSPYGSTITAADLDGRPVTVYAFADLDGDGVVGPTNSDGASDNFLERQEAFAYAGRQVGTLTAGRALGSIGAHLAAPASMGGLRISLSAGAFTGGDASSLYSDGTPIYTLWPFFPPLDPDRVLEGANSPTPDPTLPSELKFDIERNYLPAPGHPVLGSAFAVAVDGSEGSTDQYLSVSGAARATRFFAEVEASAYRPTSRAWLRPAPGAGGSGRVLVLPLSDVELDVSAPASAKQLRLLPVDLLGNVADTPPGGIAVEITAVGPVRIVSPDADVDDTRESLTLGSAAGIVVTLDHVGEANAARLDVTSGGRILDSLSVQVVDQSADRDADSARDDGNASGVVADAPCNDNDGGSLICDDNCPLTANEHQMDSNLDGLGDCCDGECIADPSEPYCGECEFVGNAIPPGSQAISKARWRLRIGRNGKPDKLKFRGKLTPTGSAMLAPDAETFSVSLVHAGETLYGATLESAFSLLSARPKYRYDDPAASVSGVRRVTLSGSGAGTFSLVLQAVGLGLAPPSSGSWQLAVTVGDDSFVGASLCAAKPNGISCR